MFSLSRPCAHCPFRTDRAPFLSLGRAREIAHALRGDLSFHCHKTVDYSDGNEGCVTGKSLHCAGATIILEKEERSNQMMRISERLGLYDKSKLDYSSPVPDSLDEWVAMHKRRRAKAGAD